MRYRQPCLPWTEPTAMDLLDPLPGGALPPRHGVFRHAALVGMGRTVGTFGCWLDCAPAGQPHRDPYDP